MPCDLVIDHSVQVDHFGSDRALALNVALEYDRNRERYQLLKFAQRAFENFRAVPPGTGIVHQVNLEYLAPLVQVREQHGALTAYPDSCVGTDSHTTMINGLGVLGWGVGGIEAEAVMLGQPYFMLIPDVIGMKLTGELPLGTTATDLVLTATQMLRKKGVVDKFVEFYGPGLSSLGLADRATIANMAPEYGATMGFFPVDAETIRYLERTGRDAHTVKMAEAYYKAQGLFRTDATPDPEFTATLELDLSTVKSSMAGPKRPQDLVPLDTLKRNFYVNLPSLMSPKTPAARREVAEAAYSRWIGEGGGNVMLGHPETAVEDLPPHVECEQDGERFHLRDGSVVIAAITSCTNTSNPSVMIGAGLLAKKAIAKGLRTKPWVKTSLAPGSRVVTGYLEGSGLQPHLDAARLPDGGLRLHHLHREQRSAARGHRQGDRGSWPGGGGGAERQPELRGAGPPVGAGQLPRVAAAGGGVRTRGSHRPRCRDGAAGHRQGWISGVPARHLAQCAGDQGHHGRGAQAGAVHQPLRQGVRRRRGVAGAAGAHRQPLRVGQGLHVRAGAAVLPEPEPRAEAARGHQRGARTGGAGRLGDDRSHLAGRLDPEERARRAVPARAWRGTGGLEHFRLAPG